MALCTDELTIDFGAVGYWSGKEPFKVRLNSNALSELIEASMDARRIYELFLIDRPGDVWDYVSVIVEAAPVRVTGSIQHERKRLKNPYAERYPWEENLVPFPVFDKLFYWSGDDTDPADQAWLGYRQSAVMNNFARQLLSMVRLAQGNLDWSDHLLRHIVSTVKTGTHPHAFLERKAAIAKSIKAKPAGPAHTTAFYKKLDELLRDTELVSIAYRGNGDYNLLRMLATEQRRRANRTQHEPSHAMHISALVNDKGDNVEWDSTISYFDEGLGHGDLFIQGVGMVGGEPIKALIESNHRKAPGRNILSINDEGELEGFDKDSGDGWFLYKKREPSTRRMGLGQIESRRSSELGPVLAFASDGATLFDYDKTLIVVGEGVDSQAREALAASISEWEAKGGEPVLVVFGC